MDIKEGEGKSSQLGCDDHCKGNLFDNHAYKNSRLGTEKSR